MMLGSWDLIEASKIRYLSLLDDLKQWYYLDPIERTEALRFVSDEVAPGELEAMMDVIKFKYLSEEKLDRYCSKVHQNDLKSFSREECLLTLLNQQNFLWIWTSSPHFFSERREVYRFFEEKVERSALISKEGCTNVSMVVDQWNKMMGPSSVITRGLGGEYEGPTVTSNILKILNSYSLTERALHASQGSFDDDDEGHLDVQRLPRLRGSFSRDNQSGSESEEDDLSLYL